MALNVDLIGVGSPVVDILAQVDDDFVAACGGEKGGMELVDSETMADLVGRIDGELVRVPGGSAGNTTFALAELGMPTGFIGKLGLDADGVFYKDAFRQVEGDHARFKVAPDENTARCLSMVTPDSERTMRTDLGAAICLEPHEISADDFANCRHVHVEGYLLFNPDLILAVLRAAKEAGCTISLDLASFEVVRNAQSILPDLLPKYVDMVFANEDEAAAFAGDDDMSAALDALGSLCDVAVVKLGKAGSMVKRGSEVVNVDPIVVNNVVDSTGAGDFWAAGFLCGMLREAPLQTCGRFGSILGARVVQQLGARIPDAQWNEIRKVVNS